MLRMGALTNHGKSKRKAKCVRSRADSNSTALRKRQPLETTKASDVGAARDEWAELRGCLASRTVLYVPTVVGVAPGLAETRRVCNL